MKQLKKITALVVTAAMALTLFTACVPLYLLEDFYDWFFGSGGSSASRSNGDGVTVSETLENKIRQELGTTQSTIPRGSTAQEILEKVAKEFDNPKTWLTNDNLNDTAQSKLNDIVDSYLNPELNKKDEVLINVKPQDKADKLSEGVYCRSIKNADGSGLLSENKQPSNLEQLKTELQYCASGTKQMCAGTFTKDGKTYYAFVIFIQNIG